MEGDFGDGQLGVVQQDLDFGGELFLDKLFWGLPVDVLRDNFVQVAWGDAELVSVKGHLMLLRAVFPHQLQELVEEDLLTAVGLLRGGFLLNGIEEPHQQALQVVVGLLLAKLGIVVAEQHLRHVHPEVYFPPSALASGITRMAVARMFVGIIIIRCVNGEHGLQEHGLGKEQDACLQVSGSFHKQEQASGQENQFGLFFEGVLLYAGRNERPSLCANQIEPAFEVQGLLA